MKKRNRGVPPSLHSYHESQIPKLVGSLFREGASEMETCSIFAISSVQSGEGASTIALLVARELAKRPGHRVLLASTDDLGRLTPETLQHPETCWKNDEQTGLMYVAGTSGKPAGPSVWSSDPRFVRSVMQLLRQSFHAVLLDTGPLLTSNDVPRMGYLVDGVVLVVQADRSTKPQIEHALQILSLAGGKLKGFVLNRRTYPIPDRIYRWLRS